MATWAELVEYFRLVPSTPVDLVQRHNIAPSQQVSAIRVDAHGGRVLATLKWGFVPSWSKDGKIAPINAMSETVAEKPMFRAAFKKRRCLLPATGFYEWVRSGKKKQPYHFRLRSGGPAGLAGIWETWHDPEDGEIVETVAILTTEANEVVRPAHNRMPVILPPDRHASWLDPAVQDVAALEVMLQPYPPEAMEAVAVSDYVNNARHEGPECLAAPAAEGYLPIA
jgi:putative SOS response-associated peptidase YedK